MSRVMLSVLAGGVVGLASVASGGTVDLPRFPSVSPDGSEVVFSWGGDLWKASTADRGEARAVRLTVHPQDDLYSAWSPDGDQIAFSTTREGGMNVWVMNSDGSGLERWTQTDRSFVVSQWVESGVVGHGFLGWDAYKEPRPFVVDGEHKQFMRAHDAQGRTPRMSLDGERVLWEKGYNNWSRRHYEGPANRDVFLYDSSSDTYSQVTTWAGNDGHAHFVGDSQDRIAFLSDRELDTVNVYVGRLTDEGVLDEASVRRLTGFEGKDVHGFSVSADGETAVVAVWDKLYALDMGDRNPRARELRLVASVDDVSSEYRLQDVRSRASAAALSPDGKVMAVVAYGDVWIQGVADDSPSRRVTETTARETSVAWSPDGTRLYFASDMGSTGEGEGGASSIYAATVSLTRGEITERFEPVEEPEAEEGDGADGGSDGEGVELSEGAELVNGAVGGVWSASLGGVDVGAGPVDMPAEFTVSVSADGSVAGTMTVMGGVDVVVTSVTFADGVLQISGVYMEEGFSVELNVSGESATGSWSAAGMSGAVSATRTSKGEIVMGSAEDPAAEEGSEGDEDEGSVETASDEDESEADDPKRWHDAVRFAIEPIVAEATNDRNPQPSPDGTELSFQRGLGEIVIRDLFTGEERVVLDTWNTRVDWRFSPNGEWIAYSTCDMDFNYDVFVVPSDLSAEAVNISMHPDTDSQPRWSADGKILAFVSERTGDEYDVWSVYLDKALDSMNETELKAYYEQAKKDAKAMLKPVDPIDWSAMPEAEGEEGEGVESEAGAELDLADAYLRLRRVTSLGGNEFNLELSPSGERYVFTGNAGGSGLFSVNWKGQDRKRLSGSASVQGLSRDGGKVVTLSGGRGGFVNVGGGGAKSFSIGDRVRVDNKAESRQKFAELARTLGAEFYHDTMKDLDWAGLSESYGEWAGNARTSGEFSWVANRLLGELNGSHLGVFGPGSGSDVAQSAGRLGIDFSVLPVADGRVHYRIDRVLDGGPAADGSMALLAGDVITGVEFREIMFGETLEQHLRGRVGDETVISIDRPSEAEEAVGGFESFELIVTPISYGAEGTLRYVDWQAQRRELVDAWSGGRLGYLHIEGMGQPQLEEFERDLFAAAYGKDGLIVDVRSNGGGWTTDRILSSIMVHPHAYTVSRGADHSVVDGYPRDRLFIQRYIKPMSVLCNQQSFSNAEIFSHAFKTLGRGTLVGEQTFGGVISTGAFSLIDGTRVRLPFRGWFLPDGTDMESNGAIPDLEVLHTPADEASGEDLQLKAAVEELLGRL